VNGSVLTFQPLDVGNYYTTFLFGIKNLNNFMIRSLVKVPRIKKEDQIEITLFKPAEIKTIDLSICLSGERSKGYKLTEGVLHIYNYLIKKSLGQWEGEFGSNWIQIPYETLRSFLTHSYLDVIDNLVKSNYLEVKDWCEKDSATKKRNWKAPVALGDKVKKGECKLYRIPQHLFGKDKKYTHEKIVISKKDIKKFKAINERKSQVTDEYRRYICAMMQSVVITDTRESRALIEELFAKNEIRLNGDDFINLFNYSPFNETVIDDFGYRCHSQVVNTPKELRSAMRFSDDLNSELVEIDIVNSQPAILASINAELIKRFVPECGAAIPLFEAMEGEAEWAEFQAQCFNGSFYETLADKYNQLYADRIVTPITRSEAKEAFYVAAFSDYEYMEALNLKAQEDILIDLVRTGLDSDRQKEKVNSIRSYTAFKTLFPTVHQLFRDIKNLDWSKINPSKKHSNNCLLAQRIESGIIYTVFTKSLIEAGIEKIVTIHDAFFLRKQDEARARKIIQQEMKSLNLNLRLKNK
jgi:hypothetical protein